MRGSQVFYPPAFVHPGTFLFTHPFLFVERPRSTIGVVRRSPEMRLQLRRLGLAGGIALVAVILAAVKAHAATPPPGWTERSVDLAATHPRVGYAELPRRLTPNAGVSS